MAGGARVVVHLLRIRAVRLPRAFLPRSRAVCALRLTLNGHPRMVESLYGFTDRRIVLNDMLAHAAKLGHVIIVTGKRTRSVTPPHRTL